MESDDVERWLHEELENPASEPLERATTDRRLSPDDWACIVRYLAAQHVRTPAWFEAQLKRWHEWVPQLLEERLPQAVAEYGEALRNSEELPPLDSEIHREFPITVGRVRRRKDGTSGLETSVLVGRYLWFWSMKNMLQDTWKVLRKHKWTILKAPENESWYTSDDPVVCLNNRGDGTYDFGGGWARPGNEILLPLGPRHLLYTQVGRRPPQRGEMVSPARATLVQRIIVEHAHRMVFSLAPNDEVVRVRPRIESLDRWRADREKWQQWHDEQSAAEREFFEKCEETSG